MSSTADSAGFIVAEADDATVNALGALAEAAAGEGIRNVGTLVAQWQSGEQRFSAEGEALLVAIDSTGAPVGVGGLTLCPHVDGALRVRRFYVAPDWRRRGVASALAQRLLSIADERVRDITCNARASAAAPPFWESLGFEPVDEPGITHMRRRR